MSKTLSASWKSLSIEWSNLHSLIKTDSEWKIFRSFSAGLSKLHFTCPEEHFDDVFLFRNRQVLWSKLDIERKVLRLLAKYVCRNVKSAFCLPIGNLWRKTVFLKTILQLLSFVEDCPRRFGHIASQFLQRFETAFHVSRIKLWGKVFLWKTHTGYSFSSSERKVIELFAEGFWQGSQNCSLCVKRNIRGKSLLKKKGFSVHMEPWAQQMLSRAEDEPGSFGLSAIRFL